MKKAVLTLVCLCGLLLPGFTANDPEISKACEVADAYFAATRAGDLDAMFKLTAASHRDYFVNNNLAENPWYKMGLTVASKSLITIVSAEKHGEERIELGVNCRYPDVEDFMEAAITQVKSDLGGNAPPEDVIKKALPLLEKHLETIAPETMKEDNFTIDVVKENGRWLIDEGPY